MTFEKTNSNNVPAETRTGCGSCGGCSGETGRTGNQSDFGSQHSTQRQNKGC